LANFNNNEVFFAAILLSFLMKLGTNIEVGLFAGGANNIGDVGRS